MSEEEKAPRKSVFAMVRFAEKEAENGEAPSAMQMSQAALNAANALEKIDAIDRGSSK